MKKIGIAIKKTSQGSGDATFFNSGEWRNKVVDIRDILKQVTGFNSEDFLTFMSFDSLGCYITLVRRIGGRDGDNVSAWIFIPNTVKIPPPTIPPKAMATSSKTPKFLFLFL